MPEDPISLTLIIPAFNEQENLRPVCETLLGLAKKYFSDYELIVIDDSSTDGTWKIAQELSREHSSIRIFQNATNKGLGFNYYLGVQQARCRYAMLVPGDNEVLAESLQDIFAQVGTADIVVTHISNRWERPLARQITSRAFTHMMNLLFGLRLHYYNGINVIRTALVRECSPRTNGFAYMALILVQLIKKGNSYTAVGFKVQKRVYGVTKAFRIKNILSVLKSVVSLWLEICGNEAIVSESTAKKPIVVCGQSQGDKA